MTNLTDLLDAAIAATPTVRRGGAPTTNRIVSEEHDTANIRVEESAIAAAVSRSAGVSSWDAAEYGITAAEAARRLESADSPEARARVLVELKRLAVARAGLDTSTGKVAAVVVGEPAWHGLGVNVAGLMRLEEVVHYSRGLVDFPVTLRQLLLPTAAGELQERPFYEIVRTDTDKILSQRPVGDRYKVIQTAEAFAFMDSLVKEFDAKFHSAIAIHGGQTVAVMIDLPKQSFKVKGRDEVRAHALFSNPFDGVSAARCMATDTRVVCANTHRVAVAGAKEGLSIRHTGSLNSKLASAREALGLVVKAQGEYAERAEAMASTAVPNPVRYFNNVLDAVCDVTEADALKGADVLAAATKMTEAEINAGGRERKAAEYARQIVRRERWLTDLQERFDGDLCGLNGIRGTAWASFNAVSEFSDHSPLFHYKGTDHERASNRFESLTTGRGDEIKQIAYERALKYVKA